MTNFCDLNSNSDSNSNSNISDSSYSDCSNCDINITDSSLGGVSRFLMFSDKGGLSLNKHVKYSKYLLFFSGNDTFSP